MNLTEAILVVVIIILIVTVVMKGKQVESGPGVVREWDCVDKANGGTTSVKLAYSGAGPHSSGCKCPKCSSPELASSKENCEFFTSGCGEDAKLALHNMCGDEAEFAYAKNDFGAPGLSYKDYVTSMAVDNQVIANHSQFVTDRLGNVNQNILGTTRNLGDCEFQMQPWVGLRRPEAVPVCNPTQVPDLDYDWFAQKPKFTWSSS